jgi:hypothetical protein
MNNITIYIAVLVVALVVGAIGGYRFAEGRCAVEREEYYKAIETSLVRALDDAADRMDEANRDAALAAQKAAELEARQQKERIIYVRAKPAPDCVLPDDTYRMLIDVIHRANDRVADDNAGRVSATLPNDS